MENNKIKICYILPFYEEGTDTHLFYNYELIKKLASRNEIELSIIIEKCPKLSFGQIKEKLGISNCYVQRFKNPILRFLEIFARCMKMQKDGYHDFYVHYSYYGALAAFLAGGKVFYWNRGMPWLFTRNWFKEKIFRFILKNTILVTGPESLAKEYQARYGVRYYRVLSNWVDVERFAPPDLPRSEGLQQPAYSPARELLVSRRRAANVIANLPPSVNDNVRIVLFVHHLSKRKGADLIPEIARGFGDEVQFLVIGDGPEKEHLERCGLSNVKVLGKIPNRDMTKYFQSADVFLMPSREEGSPHVILEAIASGLPFVASDVGGVREVVPDTLTRYLCVSEDVECFRKKLGTLLSDKELYNKAREDCLEYAKNFDIPRGLEEFINLFK